jgi:hypothetical protein
MLKMLNTYKGIAQAQVGNGETVLFWSDLWNGKVLQLDYPQLFSFAKNKSITVKSVLEFDETHELFHLPLSEEAYLQFCEMDIYLQLLQTGSRSDTWSYIWGNGKYTSAKAYKQLIGSQQIHPAFSWLWSSSCQLKHKVFFWLILQDRLNTRGLLKRRNMQLDSYTCELCILQKEEGIRHLFFGYAFAKNCWATIGVVIPSWLRPDRATRHLRIKLSVPFAMEIIITMCWSIWLERNAWIFNNVAPEVQKCQANFKKEFDLVIYRSKKKYKEDMRLWLLSL